MPDYTGLLDTMKRAGKNAMDADDPVHVCFGRIIQTSPIRVLVEQKISLGKAQLVLTETVSKTLQLDDQVILLRVQGGQKYVIVDKAVQNVT